MTADGNVGILILGAPFGWKFFDFEALTGLQWPAGHWPIFGAAGTEKVATVAGGTLIEAFCIGFPYHTPTITFLGHFGEARERKPRTMEVRIAGISARAVW